MVSRRLPNIKFIMISKVKRSHNWPARPLRHRYKVWHSEWSRFWPHRVLFRESGTKLNYSKGFSLSLQETTLARWSGAASRSRLCTTSRYRDQPLSTLTFDIWIIHECVCTYILVRRGGAWILSCYFLVLSLLFDSLDWHTENVVFYSIHLASAG